MREIIAVGHLQNDNSKRFQKNFVMPQSLLGLKISA